MSTGDWFGLIAIVAFASFFVLVGLAAFALDLTGWISPRFGKWWSQVQKDTAQQRNRRTSSPLPSLPRQFHTPAPTPTTPETRPEAIVVEAHAPETHDSDEWKAYPRIHRTATGITVRSKSEVIVADTFTRLGLEYEYEKRLYTHSRYGYRVPDFTLVIHGRTWFWEHLGLLHDDAYRSRWEDKQHWYEASGYSSQLIVSSDSPSGGIDASEIEMLIRTRILGDGATGSVP